MKGVILAGGTGERLMPLTKVTNKHLLPVYDEPMIYYPLKTLIGAGIRDIMVVSGKGHAGHFLELLGSGKDFGVKLSYAVQEKAGGIAQALSLTDEFADGEPICVILGDNIFEDCFDVSGFRGGARIYLKEVEDPERFGVATMKDEKVVAITEKPRKPASNYAVTGIYIYDKTVFDRIRKLKPSRRGEIEITEVNDEYVKEGRMDAHYVNGFWSDAGTFKSLFRASEMVMKLKAVRKK